MTIRKSAGCALAATLLLGTVCVIPPQTTDAQAAVTAQSEPAVLTRENASLFLPESYEQYLSLQTPTDVAFTEDYIAIADGSYIYLYDRTENVYHRYEHTTQVEISKLQFSDAGRLYFSDTTLGFYELDLTTFERCPMGISLSTFYIADDTIFVASVSNQTTSLYALVMQEELSLEGRTPFGSLPTANTPRMTYADGTLYCAVDVTVYAYSSFNGIQSPDVYLLNDTTVSGLTSLCSFRGQFYYTVSGTSGGLFRTDLQQSATLLLSGTSFTALTTYADTLYLVSGSAVCALNIEQDRATFTDYEISSRSSATNRLSQASDTARAGELLVTADAGNQRVSIYNFANTTYTMLPCSYNDAAFTPSLIATDGETIAIASGANIYTFSYGDDAMTYLCAAQTTVRGICVVYGQVYYVTENSMYGNGETSVYHNGTPTGLTADLYGNLFVSLADGSARKFTEETFMTTNHTGEEVLPAGTISDATSLRADFEGNLYYLSGGALCKNGEPFASVDGSDFVYGAGSAQPLSFALGYEDDAVYFNFGDYVVVSHASTEAENGPLAGIPTLGEIAEDGARQTTFSLHEAQGLLVTVAARSVGVDTDLAAFRASDSAYFPYCGYSRSRDEQQGLLLASTSEEAGGYFLVVFPEEDGSYTARLYKAASVSPVESTWREESGVRWLSNAVCLSYAPCLEPSPAEGLPSLAAQQLTRGACVTVLGSFTAPDREYTLVEYAGEAREAVRGWVPTAYLSEVSPGLTLGEDYTLAYLKSDEEGIAFTAADGSQMTVTQRVQVRLYDNGDGTYTARLADNTAYSAAVTQDMLDTDNAEVLRIALIVILSVLALVIVGVYLFLLPWDKYRKKRR